MPVDPILWNLKRAREHVDSAARAIDASIAEGSLKRGKYWEVAQDRAVDRLRRDLTQMIVDHAKGSGKSDE